MEFDIVRYISSLVAFAVIIGFLWWKGAPPVRRMMRARQAEIRHQIEEAKRADERLAEAERKYQDAVAEARAEAATIRDTARADAERIREEMRERADAEVQRIRQRGEEHLVTMHQQVVRELRAQLGGLSTELAGRIVREHLADERKRSETVDRFLGELEAMAAPEQQREDAPAVRGEA